MEDEQRNVLAYYLQCIQTERLKEDLAEDCKLRWHTGRSVRNPEAINEFFRFYIGPQYMHANFIASNEPCNPQKMAEIVKRYNLTRNPSNAPNRKWLTRNLNHVSHNEDICNQAESDIGDPGTSLDEDEHQQIERTPPPSTRKQTSSTSAATQLNDCNVDETTLGLTESTHLCLQAFGEIRHNANNTSATVAELSTTVDAVVKVRLVLFYRLCLLTGLPVFVVIFYERNDDNERCHVPSARRNLYTRLQATSGEDVVVDNDNDEIHGRIGMEHTPPPSATTTTPDWVMTPGSVPSVSDCNSVANTSNSRKRQHDSDARSVMTKRKAMRRLRL